MCLLLHFASTVRVSIKCVFVRRFFFIPDLFHCYVVILNFSTFVKHNIEKCGDSVCLNIQKITGDIKHLFTLMVLILN
jgi:hypothetical protein